MQLGFYGSTPAYRPVLEHHGWGDLGDELNRLSKAGDWVKMGEAIDDEVVETFAIVADRDTIAAEVAARGSVAWSTGSRPASSPRSSARAEPPRPHATQGRLATQRSSAGQARAHSAVTIS